MLVVVQVHYDCVCICMNVLAFREVAATLPEKRNNLQKEVCVCGVSHVLLRNYCALMLCTNYSVHICAA